MDQKPRMKFRFAFNRKSKTCPERGRRIQNQKWGGIVAIALTFALCGVVVEAQQPKKVLTIGYLSGRDAASDSARSEGIRMALREHGHIEGQNIATEYRYAEGNIVMVGEGTDPVEAGHVESLARPGGNITGITNIGGELGGKRLEMFKEAVPKLARVAVVYDPAIPVGVREVKDFLPAAARALRLTIQPWEVRVADGFERVFAALKKDRPDGLYVPGGGSLINTNSKRMANFALKSRLPSMYGRREAVDAGGLMQYGADLADSYRRVAYFVDRILKGAKPAELPVEQPTKFELVINLKTAKQIGLTIPPNVLARADRVIK